MIYLLSLLPLFYLSIIIKKWVRLPKEKIKTGKQPLVSLLIAVRNEEENILKCLKSIEALNYPKEKIEVLIGNDHSTDQTEKIIKTFSKTRDYIRLYNISQINPRLNGKANTLAYLSKKAKSNHFFFTDGDVVLPPDWIEGMLSECEQNVGIVTGTTDVSGNHSFAYLQSLDWLFALSIIKFFADLKLPVTSLGNNMLVLREAYEAAGGYDNIPYTATEDLFLFKNIIKKGYDFRQVMNAATLIQTLPMPNVYPLLQQRKRWMQGFTALPWYASAYLFLQATYLPLLIAGGFISLKVALIYFLVKKLLLDIHLLILTKELNKTFSFKLFLYDGYQYLSGWAFLIFYILPIKVNWKGRKL